MLYEDMKLELNIKCSGSASMMKVAEIIGGNTADIHRNLARNFGLEYLLLLVY